MRPKWKFKLSKKYAIIYLISAIYLLFTFFPLYDAWIVSLTPFKWLFKTRVSPPLINGKIYFKNYSTILSDMMFQRSLMNTVLYSVTTSAISLLLAAPAAYALSRLKFKGRTSFLFALLVTNMFSIMILIFPLKLLMLKFHLDNTYFSVILVDAVARLAFSIWMMWAFFDTIPKDLDEAAMVDGCSRLRALYHVILPLIAPGLFTTLLFNIVAEWQSFTIPIVFITSRDLIPVTVHLFAKVEEMIPEWNLLMAGSFITIIPELALALFLQRYLVKGLTAGAVK